MTSGDSSLTSPLGRRPVLIVWFRTDLRIDDNPALAEALEKGVVIPVYIHDPESEGVWRHGAASHWWLHQSLQELSKRLDSKKSRLILRQGDSLAELSKLIKETGAAAVYWNRRYEPAVIARDKKIKETLKETGVDAQSFNANLLNEPWTIQTGGGTPFKVFTPYWNKCAALGNPAEPKKEPAQIQAPAQWPSSVLIQALRLMPKIKRYEGMFESWKPGEMGARSELELFLNENAVNYLDGRDTPSIRATSRMSPYFHFGEISPRRIWHEVQKKSAKNKIAGWIRQAEGFIRQIYWREFAYHLLYHFPATTDHPLREEFKKFEWKNDKKLLKAWQKGQTGYPIVDAGMRELWHTGWMHNRVRMIAASFLVKDLLVHWREGARWFWDTLVDADLANNTLGWQWVAGCGADAAPYFRIFNPFTQGEKFDEKAAYVRKWVPEIAGLPDKWIHRPWEAPAEVLVAAQVQLGKDYPKPLVDHADARLRALMLYDRLRQSKKQS